MDGVSPSRRVEVVSHLEGRPCDGWLIGYPFPTERRNTENRIQVGVRSTLTGVLLFRFKLSQEPSRLLVKSSSTRGTSDRNTGRKIVKIVVTPNLSSTCHETIEISLFWFRMTLSHRMTLTRPQGGTGTLCSPLREDCSVEMKVEGMYKWNVKL